MINQEIIKIKKVKCHSNLENQSITIGTKYCLNAMTIYQQVTIYLMLSTNASLRHSYNTYYLLRLFH